MTNRNAILIALGLFLGGLLSGLLAGFLAGSKIFFFGYLLAAFVASVAFLVEHLLRGGNWRWLLPVLIITVGIAGLVYSGWLFAKPIVEGTREAIAEERASTIELTPEIEFGDSVDDGFDTLRMATVYAEPSIGQTADFFCAQWLGGNGWAVDSAEVGKGATYCTMRFAGGGGALEYGDNEFAPEAPPFVEEAAPPEVSVVDDLPWICDDELFGRYLFDPNAETLVIDIPAGYDYVQVTSDSAIVNGVNTNGKGYLALSEVTLEIATRNGNVAGVGWNDENLRWNVHACAVPPQFDVVEAFLDWQFAQISGDDDRSGDHKPSGYLFLDEDTVILWENTNFRNQAADNPTVEELWNLILESLSAE